MQYPTLPGVCQYSEQEPIPKHKAQMLSIFKTNLYCREAIEARPHDEIFYEDLEET